MRFLLFLFLLPLSLLSRPISQTLLEADAHQGVLSIASTDIGVSGLIVRHFSDQHSAIIANAVVTGFDKNTQIARLKFSPFDGLQQNSLPSGTWSPQKGDEVLLAHDYSRALLIAPTDEIYHEIIARNTTLQWIHPDEYAAYLSIQGHPTPTKEDFAQFCTVSSTGLLYLYVHESLFTLDCRSMALLQISTMPMQRESVKLPFYSRVANIRDGWWGEGSEPLETYDPYYLELIRKNNPENRALQTHIETTQNDAN